MIVWCDNLLTDKAKRAAIKAALPDDMKICTHGKKKYWYCGAGFDCETTKTPKGYNYVYLWQFALDDTEFYGRTVASFEEFAALLDDVLQITYRRKTHGKIKKYPQLLIYDANFGFEYAHFQRAFDRLGVQEVFAKETRHPITLNIGKTLEFREALGVWGYSLKNIGDLWTKTKKAVGDLDYTLPRNSLTEIKQDEQRYTCNDVKILSELCIIAHDTYAGRAIPITGTGIIRQAVKEKILESGKHSIDFEKEKVQRLMPHNLDDYHTIMDLLYCGGLTHSNVRLARQRIKNVVCADLVSDYPAQMTHEYFPAGSLIGNRTYEEMMQHKHWYARVTFYGLESKTGHSIISQHKCVDLYHATIDNGRIYAAEMCCVYCTEIDFENIGLIYQVTGDIEFDDMHIFTQSRPCNPALLAVMWEEYEKKAKLKPLKKEAEKKVKAEKESGETGTISAVEEAQPIIKAYEQSKKFVNGCYGMTSTRIYETEIYWNPDEETGINGLHEGKRKDRKDGHELTYNEMTEQLWLSPWISIYTTAYARRIICRLINKYPDIILQYDTDSIYFLDGRKGSDELRAEMEEHNRTMMQKNEELFEGNPLFADLGTWEFDPPIDEMKVLGAKRYLKRCGQSIQLVCAGCKPAAFAKYCEEENLDPFEYFEKNMRLPPDRSKKTTLRYFPPKDKPYVDTIMDYQGNEQKVEIECCATITDIPYNLWVKAEWIDFIRDKQRRL